MNEVISVPDNVLVPIHVILGCTKSEVSKYSRTYILQKLREYYASHSVA